MQRAVRATAVDTRHEAWRRLYEWRAGAPWNA